jgi:hypothetical protein
MPPGLAVDPIQGAEGLLHLLDLLFGVKQEFVFAYPTIVQMFCCHYFGSTSEMQLQVRCRARHCRLEMR